MRSLGMRPLPDLIMAFSVHSVYTGATRVRSVCLYVCSLPGGVTIARFLGLCDKTCLACGKVMKVKNSSDVYTCSTQNCTGHFSIHLKRNIAFNVIAQVSPISYHFHNLNHCVIIKTFCFSILRRIWKGLV